MSHNLIIFAGNPTQYHAPLFRAFTASPELKIEVIFGDDIGAKPFFNPELSSVIEWDVPVLEGYPHQFFNNWSSSQRKGFWSRNNPSMIPYIFSNKSKYILIHGYDTLSSWYAYFAALLSGKKIIWRGETIEPKGGGKKLSRFIKAIILPLYFRGVDIVLYSCIANRDCLKKYLSKQNNKMTSLPCAVDNDFFQALRITDVEKRMVIRKQYGIPDDHLVIAFCGRLTKRKRIDLIIQAAAKMRVKKVSLLLIGDGPENQSLKDQAQAAEINIVIAGFVGQKIVAKLLSIADVFTILSSYDASPKAFNEAMNFPIPMLVSDGVGTSTDLIHPGVNGYILHDGDMDMLVEHFNLFAENPEKRIQMGLENANIIKNYSFEIGVTNLLKSIKANE